MSNIIVAFSKRENAVNIRNILVKSGFEVSAVCQTGAKVLQYAEMWNDGIVVCADRMQDMHYTQMREYLPAGFEILLIAPADKWSDGLPDGVVGLPMPIKIYDLVNTIEMIQQTQERRRRKKRESGKLRSAKDRQIIEEAKALLMERNHMTEDEAHKYVQKTSMESGTDMVETARMILTVMDK
ncbi:MAG TPA: ANTAR domain-containing protein [Candidatus Mediterraneibacter surreyensis]|nr:ANTAR domain-containing protein [Candidatus Mediterraneibacter surreyensis]